MTQPNVTRLDKCAFTIDSNVLDIELVHAGNGQSIGRPVLSLCLDLFTGHTSFVEITPKDSVNRQMVNELLQRQSKQLTHPVPSVNEDFLKGNGGSRHELER
jgi:hypothetical protein